MDVGQRNLSEIASRLTTQFGRQLSVDKVTYLLEHKLRPLGVIDDGTDRSMPARARSLTVGTAVIPKRLVRAATTALRPLFLWPVVVAALAGLVALDTWMVLGPGTGHGMQQILQEPGLLLPLVGLTVLAGGFHELGHATACRYGGAEPGVIGVGICVIWPAFYNDLNDSYRLSRAARIRADLGGVYFNVVFILILAAGYALTGFQPILVVIVLQHLLAGQQLLPFARLDGYYIVSDLAGVPNLFARAPSIVASLVPGVKVPKALSELTRKARTIIATWVLASVALLAATAVFIGPRLPRYFSVAKASAVLQARTLSAALDARAWSIALVSALQLAILAVPVVGIGVIVARVVLSRAESAGRPTLPLIIEPDGSQRAAARDDLERILASNTGYDQLPGVLANLR